MSENNSPPQDLIQVEGILEPTENKSGILLDLSRGGKTTPHDPFVPRELLRRFKLRKGSHLTANAVSDNKYGNPKVRFIETVDGMSVKERKNQFRFDQLTTIQPKQKLALEVSDGRMTSRIIDMFCPIGKGQRSLIVAPPRTGKTTILHDIAKGVEENHPECHLMVLLVDERPEEVTDFQRQVTGEVIASTFDEPAESHVHAAEMVIEKSRRMVEAGRDVIILLDSITRLARAYNTVVPSSGKILTGGVEANALQLPKRFFGSARNIEDGGSLTILGTALVETGSKMDEVIFEEFKGTGNQELHLDRGLVDRRIFPAINMEKSGTRKEELLYHPDEMHKIHMLRRGMKGQPTLDAMETLITRVKKTKTNAEFLMSISQ